MGTFKIPFWVNIWLLIASILVSFDSLYVIGIGFNLKQFIPEIILKLWSWYGESDVQYSSDGIVNSNGWILSQSLFNVVELLVQLLYLFVLKKNTSFSTLVLLLVSMATWWKTLLYMSIIFTSTDPVHLVPGLYCLGYQPKDENLLSVQEELAKDGCGVQLFKFHFNFYWIIFPFLIIVTCCHQITTALKRNEGHKNN
jgi:hypothetical protein